MGEEGTVRAERGTRACDTGEYMRKIHLMHVCKRLNEIITLCD